MVRTHSNPWEKTCRKVLEFSNSLKKKDNRKKTRQPYLLYVWKAVYQEKESTRLTIFLFWENLNETTCENIFSS